MILLTMCSAVRADFNPDVWSSYFAINQMAAECYSGSVERCNAVGATPHEPSFWDYCLGENYAKMLAVKANIKAVRPYFINHKLADTNRSYLAYLATGSVDGIVWQSDTQFLADIGLPTNALEETPWFKSQYPETTGGWHNIMVCLSNQIVQKAVVDWHPNVWTNYVAVEDDDYYINDLPVISAYPLYDWIAGALYLTNIMPAYDIAPFYGSWGDNVVTGAGSTPLLYAFNKNSYHENARGAWTTFSDPRTWSTNWTWTWDAWFTSLTAGTNDWPSPPTQVESGMYWTNAFYAYMVKDRPRAHLGGYATNQVPIDQYGTFTNLVEVPVHTGWVAVQIGWYTNTEWLWGGYTIITNYQTNVTWASNWYSTTGSVLYCYATNYIPVTNQVPMEIEGRDAIIGFGTAFIGEHHHTNNAQFIPIPDITTNAVPVYTTKTEVAEGWEMYPAETNIVVTNLDAEHWAEGRYFTIEPAYRDDPLYGVTNELVTTNAVTNTIYVWKYAAGATVLSGYPYAGTKTADLGTYWNLETLEYIQRTITNLYDMTPLWTGAAHIVDFYYNWQAPSNFPPYRWELNRWSKGKPDWQWHQYQYQSWSNAPEVTSYFDDFTTYGEDVPGWVRDAGEDATSNSIVFGNYVNAMAGCDQDEFSVATFSAMKDFYAAYFNDGDGGVRAPATNEVCIVGREVCAEFAAVWWNGTNGFRWK